MKTTLLWIVVVLLWVVGSGCGDDDTAAADGGDTGGDADTDADTDTDTDTDADTDTYTNPCFWHQPGQRVGTETHPNNDFEYIRRDRPLCLMIDLIFSLFKKKFLA